jgi:hypothetical protein
LGIKPAGVTRIGDKAKKFIKNLLVKKQEQAQANMVKQQNLCSETLIAGRRPAIILDKSIEIVIDKEEASE